VTSLICGALGASLAVTASRAVHAQDPVDAVLRTYKLEIVDRTGKALAILAEDQHGGGGLFLVGRDGRVRLALRLDGEGTPELYMTGKGAQHLIDLGLSPAMKPRLMFSDEDFTGRLFVGVNEPHTPDPEWKYDGWSLQFRGNGRRQMVTLSMGVDKGGSIVVDGSRNRKVYIPDEK
jgi:hypothetical protein